MALKGFQKENHEFGGPLKQDTLLSSQEWSVQDGKASSSSKSKEDFPNIITQANMEAPRTPWEVPFVMALELPC